MIDSVRQAATHSELATAIASVRSDGGKGFAVGGEGLRSLTRSEIESLERAGNISRDWSRIQVAQSFDCRRVRNCQLHGDVILGRFTRSVRFADNIELPAGIENATVANCVIGNEALIHTVRLLGNCIVAEEVVLFDCGTIVCDGNTTFGNGQSLPLGVESGGRQVQIFAEIDVELAAAVAMQQQQKEFSSSYAHAVREYTDRVRFDRVVIGRGAFIRSTPCVRNSFVGAYARIDGATLVADSTVLSSKEEQVEITTAACVTDSIVQWGSSVTSMAVVERSVLTEHSHAEQHAKVSASILGPNTAVARGEVTSSLVGPFVSMHHESLLIASLWPEGRGNVSYGAMAGANHTTKAPDQEFLPGEGMFLGLGVKIRFPADFSQAPYSVFASGVETLPQKLLFPFSLINRPSSAQPGVSTAYNEISPAWVLTDNAYALVRTESKHRSRNRARRSRFDFAILRPQIIDWIRSACRRLERVKEIKPVYTDGDIIGLGKNFLLEASRQRAIDGYRFHVRRYALMKLREKMASANARDAQVLAEVSDEPEWEHARLIVRQDLAISRIEDGLSSLSSMQEEFAKAVERSKAKDDERGPRIIDDYADVHVRAAEDPVIRQTWEETRCLQEEIKTLLTRL